MLSCPVKVFKVNFPLIKPYNWNKIIVKRKYIQNQTLGPCIDASESKSWGTIILSMYHTSQNIVWLNNFVLITLQVGKTIFVLSYLVDELGDSVKSIFWTILYLILLSLEVVDFFQEMKQARIDSRSWFTVYSKSWNR